MRSRPRKGVHDVPTMTDRVSGAEEPQRKFIKLAILELEKVRRGKENRRARERASELEGRLEEIEEEQADLLRTARVLHGAGRRAVPAPHAERSRSQSTTDFTITY
jgi:hypothetical protein